MNWTAYGAGGDGYSLSPQGAIGSAIGSAAPAVGTVLGTAFGMPFVGGALGSLASHLSSLLPFAAGPQYGMGGAPYGMGGQLAPQGAVGNWISQLAPQLGGVAGGLFGQQQLGSTLGNLAGQLGGILPFAAGPQFAPQGAVGQFLHQMAPQLGGMAGGLFGQPQLGGMLGNLAGQLGSMLPFSAGPQLMPQGAVGNWINQLAPGLGGAVGGAFGAPQLGGMLGNLAGQLGSMLPFSAAPGFGQYGQGFGQRTPTSTN